MKLIVRNFFFLLILSCSSNQESSSLKSDKDSVWSIETTGATSNSEIDYENSSDKKWSSESSYTSESFETPGLGWGYKIFDNGTLFINQPHIPAIQGNKGFTTKEKAEITAQFAILKMEQGFVPPTISPEELDSLGVLN